MPKITPVSIKRLFQNEAMPALHTLTNLWAIEDDAVIGLDLSFSYVYELTPPDLTSQTDQEIADFAQHAKNFLNTVPDKTIVQFFVQYRRGDDGLVRRYKETIQTADDIGRLVVDAKEKHLAGLFIQNRKYFMTVTVPAAGEDLKKLDNKFFMIVLKDHKKVTGEIHRNSMRRLNDTADLLLSQIGFLGVSPARMAREQIVDLLYKQLNPGRAAHVPVPKYNTERTLRTQIFFNAAENGFYNVALDGYNFRAINLFVRPDQVDVHQLMNFMAHMIPDADIAVTLMTGDQEAMMKDLHIIDSVARNINNISGFRQNYEAAKKSADAKELMELVKTTFQKLFYYKLSVVLRDRSLEELTTRTNKVLQLFRLLGEAEGIIDDMNHLNLFLSGLPNNSHLNVRKHMFHSEAAAQLLPLSADWRGCKLPKLLLQTDNDELLPLDLFDAALSAKHGLLIGQTGAGKSFATNYLLTNFLIESDKNHVVIIDIGGSYRKLCAIYGGQYLDVEVSERFAFNPFPSKASAVIKGAANTFEIDPDVTAYLTGLIQKMLKLPNITGGAQRLIETVITRTYLNCKNEQPLLGDFHQELMKFKSTDEELNLIAQDYARNLDIWVNGRYGKVVNRPNAMTINSRMVVFDLQKLDAEPDLQSIVFFVISSVIDNKLKDLSLRKMIVMDECWKLLAGETESKLVEQLYRTARKFNAAIYSISQSPQDFLATKAAGAIIANSYIKWVLKIKSGYEVLDKFGLSAPEIEKIRLLRSEKGKYSEIFLKFNEHNRVIKIQPSAVDYIICTTDPDDAQKEAAVKAAHPDYTPAQVIAELAAARERKL